MRNAMIKGLATLLGFGAVLLASSNAAYAAEEQPDVKLIEKGKVISRTVAGIGCITCHGQYGEGDAGTGPYIRGVGLSKIQAAIAAVSPMQMMKAQLSAQDIEAVAKYWSWLGQYQVVKTLLKRDRFTPEAVDIYPGTPVQVVIHNSGQVPRKFSGPDMKVAEFAVPGRELHDFLWRAPEQEGTYTLRCVDCAVQDQGLTVRVSRSARPYRGVSDSDKK